MCSTLKDTPDLTYQAPARRCLQAVSKSHLSIGIRMLSNKTASCFENPPRQGGIPLALLEDNAIRACDPMGYLKSKVGRLLVSQCLVVGRLAGW